MIAQPIAGMRAGAVEDEPVKRTLLMFRLIRRLLLRRRSRGLCRTLRRRQAWRITAALSPSLAECHARDQQDRRNCRNVPSPSHVCGLILIQIVKQIKITQEVVVLVEIDQVADGGARLG